MFAQFFLPANAQSLILAQMKHRILAQMKHRVGKPQAGTDQHHHESHDDHIRDRPIAPDSSSSSVAMGSSVVNESRRERLKANRSPPCQAAEKTRWTRRVVRRRVPHSETMSRQSRLPIFLR
jgi:hypothetical protein